MSPNSKRSSHWRWFTLRTIQPSRTRKEREPRVEMDWQPRRLLKRHREWRTMCWRSSSPITVRFQMKTRLGSARLCTSKIDANSRVQAINYFRFKIPRSKRRRRSNEIGLGQLGEIREGTRAICELRLRAQLHVLCRDSWLSIPWDLSIINDKNDQGSNFRGDGQLGFNFLQGAILVRRSRFAPARDLRQHEDLGERHWPSVFRFDNCISLETVLKIQNFFPIRKRCDFQVVRQLLAERRIRCFVRFTGKITE